MGRFVEDLPKSVRAKLAPTEEAEQATVCQWLTLNGVRFFAVPNGGARAKRTAGRLKATGVQAGVPDILIVDRPTKCPGSRPADYGHSLDYTCNLGGSCARDTVGVALEMKRSVGGRLTEEQRGWLSALERLGWVAIVGHGADDAIRQLTALGYAKRTSGGGA